MSGVVGRCAALPRLAAVGLLFMCAASAGCKKETVVDKMIVETERARLSEKAARRKAQVDAPKRDEANNWRVIAIASSYAPAGRERIDAIGEAFPWKVDIFEETGDHSYDRVEIDRDRDGTSDETWRYANGRWEKYSGRLFWSGRRWLAVGKGQVELPRVATSTKGGEPLHRAAVEMLQHRAVDYSVADFLVGHGPKISLHDDDWDARWDRAEVDRDRDGVIDEKWARKGEQLTREILTTKQRFRFQSGSWVALPR